MAHVFQRAFVAATRADFRYGCESLQRLGNHLVLRVSEAAAETSWVGFSITANDTGEAQALVAHLARAQIETGKVFVGVYLGLTGEMREYVAPTILGFSGMVSWKTRKGWAVTSFPARRCPLPARGEGWSWQRLWAGQRPECGSGRPTIGQGRAASRALRLTGQGRATARSSAACQ